MKQTTVILSMLMWVGCVSGVYAQTLNERLMEASDRGDVRTVNRLIANGADVNARDYAKWTPLHEAAGNGHEGVVKALVKRGANIHAKNNAGLTALHLGAGNGHEGVVKTLVAMGHVITEEEFKLFETMVLEHEMFQRIETIYKAQTPLREKEVFLIENQKLRKAAATKAQVIAKQKNELRILKALVLDNMAGLNQKTLDQALAKVALKAQSKDKLKKGKSK